MKLPIHTDPESIFWLSATTLLVLGTLTTGAIAAGREPLRGPHPWDFSERNRETSLALQYAHDNRNRGVSGFAAGYGGYGAAVVINNTTMAVGNWQQIEMTLGDGAEGLIMTENHQDNTGNSAAGSSVMGKEIDVADHSRQRSNDHRSGKADGREARDRSRRAKAASERSKPTDSRHHSSQRARQYRDQQDRHNSTGGTRDDRSMTVHDHDRTRPENDSGNERAYQPCGRNGYFCWGGIE